MRTWLELPNGIPPHDTFGRIFAWICPDEFAQRFSLWVQSVQDHWPLPSPTAPRVRAIDGKQCRRSHDRLHAHPALHEGSVWASESRLILANQAVDTKSNEITAIPLLLQQLDITGCIVPIDVMGCQTAIAQQICDQGADYVLALKGNQATLEADVIDGFGTAQQTAFEEVSHQHEETVDKGHGRRERRQATVITDAETLAGIAGHWPD